MVQPLDGRPGLSHDAAIALIAAEAGSRFDPDAVSAFMGEPAMQQETDDVLELSLA
jgi:HD-GYP domain-containing protein (c-di-GMP phosphodiesterase class II)